MAGSKSKRLDFRSLYVLIGHDPCEMLKYAIAFALRRARKIVRGLKDGLTEDERFAVADHVVRQLKERGDPWHLGNGYKLKRAF